MGGYYYVTQYGDMWDYIAYKVYGDEYKVGILYEANPQYLKEYIFEGGCQIWCPEIDEEDEMDEGVPEWRDEEDISDDELEDDLENGEDDVDEE